MHANSGLSLEGSMGAALAMELVSHRLPIEWIRQNSFQSS